MTSVQQDIAERLQETARIAAAVAHDPAIVGAIERAAGLIIDSYRRGGKVLLFGNGGSAADAQHLAAELVGRFNLERQALPAIALTTNTSIMSALANDYGYDRVFARQVEALVKEGDVAVGISTSGNSPNVIEAIRCARERKAHTVGLSGCGGGKLAEAAELVITAPSHSTPRVQEAHIAIGHIICEIVERALAAG